MNTSENLTQAERKPAKKFNHVWWIPFIALMVATYLVISHTTSKGPLITIQFDSAEGISVEKTKLKYKSVTIGQVEQIAFDDTLNHVLVNVRVDKNHETLIRQGSQFWIVKPRIEVTKISGLNTLLSGAYIEIDPAKGDDLDFQYEFIALTEPPITTQNKPGLRLTLLAEKSSAYYPGSSVYYRGMPVGSVERVYFSEDYLWVKVDVFIDAPHHELIKSNTKFWAASGIAVDTNAAGIDIELESIEALIAGGIAFETPIEILLSEDTLSPNTEFILYPNKTVALEQHTGKKHFFVSYFDSNISGLDTGADVVMNGISIGKVKAIQLIFDVSSGKTYTPVLFEIYEDKISVLNADNKTDTASDSLVTQLINSGLQAQIKTANILTGTKNISLAINDGIIPLPLPISQIDELTGYPILPSQPESFETITDSIVVLVDKINQMPIEDLIASANQLLLNADEKISQLELQETLTALAELAEQGSQLSQDGRAELAKLRQSLDGLIEQTEGVLSGYSPDAPLYHGLVDAITELNSTLSSLKSVSDLLERTPNALIFGEDQSQDNKQNQSQNSRGQSHGDK